MGCWANSSTIASRMGLDPAWGIFHAKRPRAESPSVNSALYTLVLHVQRIAQILDQALRAALHHRVGLFRVATQDAKRDQPDEAWLDK